MQNFDEYTQSIQTFFADALAAAEAAKQAALADRAQAACELEVAKAYKKSFLAQLILTHLNNGKSATDIMHWLGVSADFIENCQRKQEEVRGSIVSYN